MSQRADLLPSEDASENVVLAAVGAAFEFPCSSEVATRTHLGAVWVLAAVRNGHSYTVWSSHAVLEGPQESIEDLLEDADAV